MYKAQASMKETFRRMNKKYNQGVLGGWVATNKLTGPTRLRAPDFASQRLLTRCRNHMVALALFAFFLILGMYSLIRAQRFLAFFGLA